MIIFESKIPSSRNSCVEFGVGIQYTLWKTNMTVEEQPWMKMYVFNKHWGFFRPVMLVFDGMLGGGFNYFLFITPNLGEDSHFA